jgi:hypothetical protein
MKKPLLALLLVLCLAMTGCPIFGGGNRFDVDTLENKETIAIYDEARREGIEVVGKLVEKSEGVLTGEINPGEPGIKTVLRDAKVPDVAIPPNTPKIVLTRLQVAVGILAKASGVLEALADAEGRPIYPSSTDAESIEKLKTVIVETGSDARGAEEDIDKSFKKALGSASRSSFWSKIKFAILGLLGIGSVVFFIYLRMTYGKTIAMVFGGAAGIVLLGYIIFSYWAYLVIGAGGLLVVGLLVGLVCLLKEGKFSTDLISSIQTGRVALSPEGRKKLDGAVSTVMPPSAKNRVKTIKRIVGLDEPKE